MKNFSIKIRVSERRLNKLRLYFAWADKSMTAVLEELIDTLSIPEDAKSSNVLRTLLLRRNKTVKDDFAFASHSSHVHFEYKIERGASAVLAKIEIVETTPFQIGVKLMNQQ